MKTIDYVARLRRASILPLLLVSSLAAAQVNPDCGSNGVDSDGDGVPDCVEPGEFLDPATRDNDVFTNSRLFAMQQYRDLFAREGDAEGIVHWTNKIDGTSMSRAQAVSQFMASAEFETNPAAVTRLYFAYFLRTPDYAGLNFWVGYAADMHSLGEVSKAFADSDEFRARYGTLGNREFVERVYSNVLARTADAEGLNFWTAQLDNGSMDRGEVMLAFSETAEYREVTRNETMVTLAYVGMLRRAPDPGGFSFFLTYLDNGGSSAEFINQIVASAEYRSRFLN